MRYTPLFSLQGHRSDNDPRTRLQRINGAPHGPRFLHGYSLECAVTGGGFPPRRTARRSFPGGGGSGWRRCRTCQGVAKCSPGSSVIFGRPHPESFLRRVAFNPPIRPCPGCARCCKSTVVFSTRWVGGWVGDHPTRVYNSAARRLGSGAEGTEEGGTNNGTPSTRSDGDGVVSVTPTPHAPPSDRHTRCSIRARVRGNPLSPPRGLSRWADVGDWEAGRVRGGRVREGASRTGRSDRSPMWERTCGADHEPRRAPTYGTTCDRLLHRSP